MEIAKTILDQFGGIGRLVTMTGAKNFTALPNGVQFSVGKGSKTNKVVVKLTADDLYDVTFYKIRGTSIKVVSHNEGVYNDDLKPLFERVTGFYLTLAG